MIDFWPPAIFLLKISSKISCRRQLKNPDDPMIRGLHILHRQTLVFNIEFLEFTCSLKEMLSFIF